MNIDLIKTPEELEDCPLTRYFLETKKRNALEWISFLDDDTLSMARFQTDLFENEQIEKNSQNQNDKYDDIVNLTVYMLAHERKTNAKNIIYDTSIDLHEALKTLIIYLNCDSMRRKGLVEFEYGNGQLLNSTSKFNLTIKGEKFSKKIAKNNGKE